LILEGVELFESVLRRFGEGSSVVAGVDGEEEAAALCINFIVKSREDMDFGGVGTWPLVADILTSVKMRTSERNRSCAGYCGPFISFLAVQEHWVLGRCQSVVFSSLLLVKMWPP
jgi:hypothetical protein